MDGNTDNLKNKNSIYTIYTYIMEKLKMILHTGLKCGLANILLNAIIRTEKYI